MERKKRIAFRKKGSLLEIVLPKRGGQKAHDRLFWSLSAFTDDIQHRRSWRAMRAGPAVTGQNFSRRTLKAFLKLSRPGEFAPARALFGHLLHAYPKVTFFISYVKGDRETRAHELCHWDFFRSASYRNRCRRIWKSLPRSLRRRFRVHLRSQRYHDAVHLDEWQAYVRTKPLSEWTSEMKDLTPSEKLILKSTKLSLIRKRAGRHLQERS